MGLVQQEDSMKSPITGKEMTLVKEIRTINCKGKDIEVEFWTYLCEESGEKFTDTDLDTINMNEIQKQCKQTKI